VTPSSRRGYDDVLAHISAKRRKHRARKRRGGRRSLIATLAVAFVIGLLAVGAAAAAGTAIWVNHILSGVSLDALTSHPPGVNTQIYDRNGNLLETISSTENRTPVSTKHISPWMKKATVAIEDRRFYQHGGVDPWGIVRAAYADLAQGGAVQGASTIEQQLVRNLYLSDAQTLTRKIREAWLATEMANTWSKDKILTTYLNVVPYGAITYGCEAAALRFYDTHCRFLNIDQAATIAGLPQNPIVYNPIAYPKAARDRRDEVLQAMLDAGYITQNQYNVNVRKGLGIHPGNYLNTTKEGYFVSWVRQQLEQNYGTAEVQRGGLKVYTTLDPKLQQAAHQALTDTMTWPNAPAAAMVAIDPRTGQVLAMDASVPYSQKSQFNLPVNAGRTAGSTFKAFTLSAAINMGINPDTFQELSAHLDYTFANQPLGPSNPWSVDTAEVSTCGCAMTITHGTIESDNTVFARLAIDIGGDKIVNMAHRLGIPNSIPLSTGPAITLGVSPVSPLWMTAAYSTLADNGIRHNPLAITKVEEGENTKNYQSHGWQAVPDGVAYEADTVLAQTVEGTAFRTPLDHGVQAGKTGTAENYQDAWFCGFTPTLASCVWMGYPKSETPMTTLPGYGDAFGGDYPAEMWTQFMKSAFQLEPHTFPPVAAWPLPKHPVIWKPFHSQFTLVPPNPCAPVNGVVPNTPTCRPQHQGKPGQGTGTGGTTGGTTGTTGGGTTGGGTTGGGTTGGGGSTGPPPTT
jgi:penicillin-binding protein 1A